ncbi:rhodanese-like domain-containing protein [Salicola sp. Rm-C-2C1-2]|uniref:rhodanese-like domain-containing protein n=1 Tax=Salicola sp. Rm-C-2C1-2 TaxID=3141321 RepID=UPI0032E39D2B
MSIRSLPEIVGETKANLRCLTPQAARDMLADQPEALVIDVREPLEVSEKQAAGTINLPRGVLEMKIPEYTTDPETPIFLHCATGGRAALAAEALERMGFRHVSIIDCSCDEVMQALGAA